MNPLLTTTDQLVTICANLVDKGGTRVAMQRSCVRNVDGVRVGIVGLTLPGAVFGKADCRALSVARKYEFM